MAALLTAGTALAGPPPDAIRVVQAAAAVGPLAPGAIRFTAVQKGRSATVYQAERGPNGVSRTVVDLSPDANGRWAIDGRDSKPMAAETLDYFTARFDAAIKAAPAPAECDSGVDYYVEHGADGLSGGGCSLDHPNAAIARALGLADPVQP